MVRQAVRQAQGPERSRRAIPKFQAPRTETGFDLPQGVFFYLSRSALSSRPRGLDRMQLTRLGLFYRFC
jgi:hypothetical protein